MQLQGAVAALQALAQLPNVGTEEAQPAQKTGEYEPFEQMHCQRLSTGVAQRVE